MDTETLDPQDLLRTIGVARPVGDLALDLYRPNPANLPAVVRVLADRAGIETSPLRSHFELLELVRMAQLDPADAFAACGRADLLPRLDRPHFRRTFRWLDRLDAIERVYVQPSEAKAYDRMVLLGLMNGGTRAVPASVLLDQRPKQGGLGQPVLATYPAHGADLAFFAGAAETVRAVEAQAWALHEALVAWGLTPLLGVAWSFRPLRWAVRSMDFSVLAPVADAVARVRLARGWEPRRVASVARHFEWADGNTQKLAQYLDGFLASLAEWERLVAEGATVPPNEDLAPEDRAFPPLADALVGRPFAAMPNPYAPLVQMLTLGVMPRWVNQTEQRIEIALPSWAREDA